MNNAALRIADYRRRAIEVRMIAEGIADRECRDNLLGMAGDYERMAAWIEAQRRPKLAPGTTVH